MQSLLVRGTKKAPSLVVSDTPRPSPGIGEVLIRVASAGLMPTELGWPSTWSQTLGAPRVNAIPSHEFSGTVEMLGPAVDGVSANDEVFGMNDWFTEGGMAEYCVARVEHVAPKPRRLTHPEAASVPISALTAWQALFDHGSLQAGQRVLIHGAAGGVGNFAVQLAKHHDAYVAATASSPNLDFVRQLGANQVFDYRAEPFEESVGKMDLVVDAVGGDTLRRSWSVLAPGGRLVTVASSTETEADERSGKAFFIVEPNRNQLMRIASFIDEGIVKTFVKSTISLSDAAREYAAPRRGTGYGKTVVTI